MAYVVDLERREVKALRRVAPWRGKRVIEIGCGDGRLTLRIARLGARVLAIDPDAASIRTARRSLPERLAGRVRYRVMKAQRIAIARESFDLALFSWSL
ncbi:MAG TPA: class I SAM-dependent methyltransferase [Candidatus Eisenbacteria bacterium]